MCNMTLLHVPGLKLTQIPVTQMTQAGASD